MIIGTAKETYRADAALLTTQPQRVWMAIFLAALLVLPFMLDAYWLYLVCLAMINVGAATGLNILTGYTGLVSLGQAAFMAVGAYTVAWLERELGTPMLVNLAAAGGVAAAVGVLAGIPSLRVKGLYLAIATIAASFILHFVFIHWVPVTGGASGISVPPATFFGIDGFMGVMPYRYYYDEEAGAPTMAKIHERRPEYQATGYMQGYLSAILMAESARRVLEAGQELTGSNLKAAMNTIEDFDTGGLIGIPISIPGNSVPVGRVYQYSAAEKKMQPVSDWITVTE